MAYKWRSKFKEGELVRVTKNKTKSSRYEIWTGRIGVVNKPWKRETAQDKKGYDVIFPLHENGGFDKDLDMTASGELGWEFFEDELESVETESNDGGEI